LLEIPRWLLLIHQIPPKPDYFRVKIWRRLQRVGALAIKNSVYVLPMSDRAQEDLQWILSEIVDGGGDASLCEARFVDGLSDEQIEAMFHAARDADYEAVASQARRLVDDLGRAGEERRAEIAAEADRLRRRLAEIVLIDLLGAPGRDAAEAAVETLEHRLEPAPESKPAAPAGRDSYLGRVWVTRKGIHVDRMASAWLIRRFIDEQAAFEFVPAKGYRPERGEVRFDMFEAEFTHQGSSCTFEVLLDRFGLHRDPGLSSIAEIVHELDVRDGRFERDEIAGIGALVTGISLAHREDRARLEASAPLFDGLYEHFRRRRR
jgi:hypothetical protein